MSTIEEVETAAQQFNGYEIEGRALRVNAGPPPPKSESPFRALRSGGGGTSFDNNNKVYVGNLSWGVDDLALKTLLSEQGQVIEARVIYDRDSGRSKGFGFVTYNSADEVNNAIESLDGAFSFMNDNPLVKVWTVDGPFNTSTVYLTSPEKKGLELLKAAIEMFLPQEET